MTLVKRIGAFGFVVGVVAFAFTASASASETDQFEPDHSEAEELVEPTESDEAKSEQPETVSSGESTTEMELEPSTDSEDRDGETQPALDPVEGVSEALGSELSCGEGEGCLPTDQAPAEAQAGTTETETGSELPETDNVEELEEGSSSAVVSGEFNDGKILNRDHADTTSKVDVALDSQFYEVVLESKDETHKSGFAEDQTHEQWVLDGLSADGSTIFTTEPTADLPDGQTMGSDNVGTYDFTGVTSVQGRHARFGTSVDSIEPYRFTLNPSQPEVTQYRPVDKSRVVVFKDDERIDGTSLETELVDVGIEAGEYRIFLVSEDKNHPEQETQLHEQWKLKGFNDAGQQILETFPTRDLPDGDSVDSSYVGSYNLTSRLATVQGEHARLGKGPNSITPVSAVFFKCAADCLNSVAGESIDGTEFNDPASVVENVGAAEPDQLSTSDGIEVNGSGSDEFVTDISVKDETGPTGIIPIDTSPPIDLESYSYGKPNVQLWGSTFYRSEKCSGSRESCEEENRPGTEISSSLTRRDVLDYASDRCSRLFDMKEGVSCASLYRLASSTDTEDDTRFFDVDHGYAWAEHYVGIQDSEYDSKIIGSYPSRSVENKNECVTSNVSGSASATIPTTDIGVSASTATQVTNCDQVKLEKRDDDKAIGQLLDPANRNLKFKSDERAVMGAKDFGISFLVEHPPGFPPLLNYHHGIDFQPRSQSVNDPDRNPPWEDEDSLFYLPPLVA